MALNVLLVEEMVSVTGPMIDPEHDDRAALLAVPASAPLLPKLEQAHEGLLVSHLPPITPERLAVIAAQLAQLDARHDDVIRGVYHVLTGEMYLAATEDERAQIRALRDLLLPDGLRATGHSYRVEAGQAALLASRLTADDLAALAAIPTRAGNLRGAVEEWIEVGGSIGALEDERTPAQRDEGADISGARNQWIRAVRALAKVLDLVAADNPAIQRILARIEEVERKATARSHARRAEEADDPAPGADAPEAGPGVEAAGASAGEPGSGAAGASGKPG